MSQFVQRTFAAAALIIAPLPVNQCLGEEAAPSAAEWRAMAIQFIADIEDEELRGDVSHEAVYVSVRAKDLEPARQVAALVTSSQKKIYAFTQVAKGYREAGEADAALAALDACWSSLDEEQRANRIEYMTEAYAQAGFIEEAQKLAGEIKPTWKQRSAIDHIARIVAQAGELDRARALVARSDRKGEQAGLASIVASLASSQKTDDALALAEDLETAETSDYAFENLADELSRTKRYAEAEQAAARITAAALRQEVEGKVAAGRLADEDPETIDARIAAAQTREEKLPIYTTLIKKHAADGNIAEAEAAIEAMIAVIKASPRPPEPSKFGKADDQLGIALAKALHLEIARELSKTGDAVAAREQVAKASDAILGIPDDAGLGKTFAVSRLVAAHIEVGDVETAQRMVEQMTESLDRNMAAKQVPRALIKSGDAAGAVAVAKLVTDPLGRGRTVGEIAGALIRAGELESAKLLLAGLNSAAEDVAGYREAGEAMSASGRGCDLEAWLPNMPTAAARAFACLGAAEMRVGPAQELAPGQ